MADATQYQSASSRNKWSVADTLGELERMALRTNRSSLASKLAFGVGVCGAFACSVTMIALPLGLVGAGVASGAKAASGGDSMAGMGGMTAAKSSQQPPWLAALPTYGPELLLGSIVLIVLALAIRRSWWASVAVVGGAVLYVGMYVQQNVAVMNASIVVGLAVLIASALGFRRSATKESALELDAAPTQIA